MHQNKYLLSFCIMVIVLMAMAKTEREKIANRNIDSDVTNALIAAEQAKSRAEYNYAGGDVDESILIKETPTSTTTVKAKQPILPKPYVTSESYLVGNLETGQVYIEHNPNKVFPIASVSKLYTALVVHHLFDLEKKIAITESMLESYGTAGNLSVDENLLPNELLYALLLESSNDAAEAFAQSFGYDNFMEQMNAFAQEIGMSQTSFEDSSGLSPFNVSNSKDLFVLAKYLYKSEKDILEISKTVEKTLDMNGDHKDHFWKNIHPYAENVDFIGGKTGRTSEAKESMVSMFKYKFGENEYPIVVIVLRSDMGERKINTDKLLEMLKNKI